ncbi:MAG: alpha/beta hydrolase [Gammaproteobacteria bacterium]|nr:MAG: alpha/beta hydrolase [Gammaproteobacteria bacterium]
MQNDIADIEYQLSSLSIKGLTNKRVDKHNNVEKPLLCLHGWLDNAASFLPLMPYLDNVLAIDWPGHGLSSHRSSDAHYHFVDYVYDLLALFDENSWPALDIVGHSMGGMIASVFAATFPEKVKSLTLIDSIGFITAEAETTTENLRQGLLSRLKLSNKQKHQQLKAKQQEQAQKSRKIKSHANLDSAIKARLSVSDLQYGDAKLLVERGTKQSEDGFYWCSDPRLMTKSPLRLSTSQAQQIISSIDIPVQLIYGDKGMDMVKLGIEQYKIHFKCFKSTMLSGGHHVHMEQPKATAALIAYFIDRIS